MSKDNKTIKKLFTFTVSKEQEVEKTEESKNEAGEVVKITKKVKENTPVSFYIKQPNRKIREDAEFYYYSKMSEAIKKEILPIILMEKHLQNDNGSLSKTELSTIAKWRDKNEELQRANLILEKDRTSEQKQNIDKLTGEIAEMWNGVRIIQQNKGSIFNACAENFSNNRLIMWYVLNLACTNDDKSFFKGETLEEKFESYDGYEEMEDPFYSTCITKFILYTSAWASMKDSSTTAEYQKEMEKIENDWNNPKKEEIKPEVKKEQEVKVEEVKKEEIIPDKVVEIPKIEETVVNNITI